MVINDKILDLLQGELNELLDKREAIDARIVEINNLINNSHPVSNLNIRIVDCLKFSNKPLTTDELLTSIFYTRPYEISDRVAKRKYIQRVSLILNRLCQKGILMGVNIENHKGKIYGLSEWENKAEYRYYFEIKKKQLIDDKNRFFTELH